MSACTQFDEFVVSGARRKGWRLLRMKRLVSECRNGIWGDDPDGGADDIPCARVADFDRQRLVVRVPLPTIRKVERHQISGRLLNQGDLLLEKSGGGDLTSVGAVVQYLGNERAICSNFVAVMRPASGIDPRWLCYLNAHLYLSGTNQRSVKQTTGIQNLDSEQYLGEVVPVPLSAEQTQIAKFLDRETARIDALIEKKTRFMDLLREKREAATMHAVTRGLDAGVTMRTSGIGWIGETPGHWRVERIASLYREVVRPGLSHLPVLSISIHTGISDDQLLDDERDRKVSRIEDREQYKRVLPGDLAYNMMRAWQGAFGAVAVEGLVSPAYVVAEPRRGVDSGYVEMLLRTPAAIEEMRRYSRGIADFRMRLYWEAFRDIRIALPPFAEQRDIVEHLRAKTARFEAVIDATERSIALLLERRAALITAAITGLIDVRSDVPDEEVELA